MLERETRFELATLALARRCSTTELFPLDHSYSEGWDFTDAATKLSSILVCPSHNCYRYPNRITFVTIAEERYQMVTCEYFDQAFDLFDN